MSWIDEVEKQKDTKEQAPVRVLIYGERGVGKTTFGCSAPRPIVLDLEKGTREIKGVKRIPGVDTWDAALQKVRDLITLPHKFQSLIIDSADWLEQLAIRAILAAEPNKKVKSLNQACGGYGNGRNTLETMHRELIGLLDELQEKRGMHVIVTAHYLIKEHKDPEAIENYDSYKLKLDDKTSAIWQEWCAAVLFARFETLVKAPGENEDGKVRAIGTGKHVMYTQKRPAFDAKNRYGLPFKLPVDWNSFIEARAAGNAETAEDIAAEIEALCTEIPDKVVVEKIKAETAKVKSDTAKLSAYRNRCRVLAQ